MENKYNNGKIYKIEPLNGIAGDVYIGSTTQELDKRMKQHRSEYKRWLEDKIDATTSSFKLFNKYNVNNCLIVLLEDVNVNTKIELHEREAFYIRSMNCINKQIPCRTDAQYYLDNKTVINDNRNERYLNNKDKAKEYNKLNKVYIAEKHKEYNKLNKVHLAKKQRERYLRRKFEKAEADQETKLNKVMGGNIDL